MSATCWDQHAAMKADRETWSKLELVGVQRAPATDDDEGYSLELRNCACGSTLALRIEVKP